MTDSFIDTITNRLIQRYDPDKIYLFGSYAKGVQTSKSDIDILVIRHSNLPKHLRGLDIQRTFYSSVTRVDCLFYTPEEVANELRTPHSFIAVILRSGKVLYEKKL